jgi:PleD family two-component response regulator
MAWSDHPARHPDVSERSVLIIDANLMDVLRVEKHLVAAGYRVSKLAGAHGVIPRIEYERPDVVLIDITMPRLNVGEVLDAFQNHADLEETVVVLFSGLDGPTLQAMCQENNIHGYFSKSMDVSLIGSFLDQFFEED